MNKYQFICCYSYVNLSGLKRDDSTKGRKVSIQSGKSEMEPDGDMAAEQKSSDQDSTMQTGSFTAPTTGQENPLQGKNNFIAIFL